MLLGITMLLGKQVEYIAYLFEKHPNSLLFTQEVGVEYGGGHQSGARLNIPSQQYDSAICWNIQDIIYIEKSVFGI